MVTRSNQAEDLCAPPLPRPLSNIEYPALRPVMTEQNCIFQAENKNSNLLLSFRKYFPYWVYDMIKPTDPWTYIHLQLKQKKKFKGVSKKKVNNRDIN